MQAGKSYYTNIKCQFNSYRNIYIHSESVDLLET